MLFYILDTLYFNPRLREGGDSKHKVNVSLYSISIHASAKEATESNQIAAAYINISIHASAKEATIGSNEEYAAYVISIHASAKEATLNAAEVTATERISIHASAKEATPAEVYNCRCTQNFNPRLREGGD